MARPSKPQPQRGVQYQGKFTLHLASGKEICKKFNSRQGCTLSACKFEHSCNMPGYGKLHSASTHSFPHPKKLAGLVKPMRDLNLEAWENELENDFDKTFLLHGIEFGFDIVNKENLPVGILAKNHPSALPGSQLYEKAHLQILKEIECGNYALTESSLRITSPLGVIPKPDGGVRLIHDCSRPDGTAVNDFVSHFEKQRFQTIDDAAKLVSKDYHMSKVDLKSAYRSVRISATSQEVTGFQWTFPDGREYTFIDKKLPFGSKLAPGIFHRLSQAVRRMMSRRGFTIIAYLDDFLICESTKDRCRLALNTLVHLLRTLGFMINWSKVVEPTTSIIFLGIEIDSSTMELRFPADKLSLLRLELDDFKVRKRASKKQLQSFAGKLNWASAVIRGGRVFLRRIIDCITSLKRNWHNILLKGEVLADIAWWRKFMAKLNGKSLLLDKLAITSVCPDACRIGAGGYYQDDWFYANWAVDFPFANSLHIDELEAFSVVLATLRWAKQWRNKSDYFF
jgi:hypothetical protein